MGTWGTGLFSDDVACDIRLQFRDLLDQGYTIPKATRRILDEWNAAIADEEDGPIIWLALASLQWDRGALQPSVKKKAIQIIDGGVNLDQWRSTADTKTVGRRKAVLLNLRRKLESTSREPNQPPARRTARNDTGKDTEKVTSVTINWRVGQLIAYKLRSGDWILLHVVQCSKAQKVEDVKPTFAVLDWQGPDIPSAEEIVKLPYKKPPAATRAWGDEVAPIGERRAYCIEVAHRRLANIPIKRLQRLSVSKELPFHAPSGWFPGVLWRLLDSQLEEDLGLP